MERIIETVATGFGGSVGWLATHGVLFLVFAVLWIAFGLALVWSQGSIDQAWQAIHGLPLVIELVVWVLFLPVIVGMWIWETTWPVAVRLVLILALAGWNLLVLLPQASTTQG